MSEIKGIIAKQTVLDRIEQTFELFKNNFIQLLLPIFIYTFFSFTIFISIFTLLLVNYWKEFLSTLNKNNVFENFEWFFYSPEIIIWITIWMILVILYVTLYIPFILATVKWIKQAYNWEKVTTYVNIKYWFQNILNIFRTYWFIFAYVALIPALIWIVWGLLFIYWWQYQDSNFSRIWAIITSIWLVLFFIFSIYRWVKSSFSIYSAIDKNSYTKENFNSSINITTNNWWRIVWNLMLIWFILSFSIGLIKSIIGGFGSSFDISMGNEIITKLKENPEAIYPMISEILNSYSPISNFIINTIEALLNSIINVATIIFSYVLLKRLEIENVDEVNNDEIEL